MIKKIFSLFWGFILVPLVLATFYNLPSALLTLSSQKKSLILLFSGAVLYVIFEVLFSRPMRTYVFGHELTHALASLAMGGKVHSFKISKQGGSVSLSKTNFLIALAPYCIPIYTFFILILYFLLRFRIPAEEMRTPLMILIGSSLAFHSSLTLFAVRQEQPDIQKTGFFFSLVFILLVNAWVLVLLSKFLFWNSFSLKMFLSSTMKTQLLIWGWFLEIGFELLKWSAAKLHTMNQH